MRTGWVQWREGDNRHEEYTTHLGQVVRATEIGWFSDGQARSRKVQAKVFGDAILEKMSPFMRKFMS